MPLDKQSEMQLLHDVLKRLDEESIQFELELVREIMYDDLSRLKNNFMICLNRLKGNLLISDLNEVQKDLDEMEKLFEDRNLFYR
jgi:hypothetical protein